MLSEKDHIVKMMKTIQTKIKNGTLNNNYIDQLREQSGGDPYNFMKTYLDMFFSTETQLKKDQQDSLERLTEIKKAEIQKENEVQKQKEFEKENILLAQNEKNFQDAKENAQKIKEQANQVDQEKNEALQKSLEAKKKVDEAEQQAANVESFNKILEDAINIRKKYVQNSEKILEKLMKSLENRELVSLEETKESMQENASIQDIHKVVEHLEKKTDDILF
jgi:epidermal growth factor receptor substrate 15